MSTIMNELLLELLEEFLILLKNIVILMVGFCLFLIISKDILESILLLLFKF